MKMWYWILALASLGFGTAAGVPTCSEEFDKPWENAANAFVLDAYEGSELDCAVLKKAKTRVAAIIFRASKGLIPDAKYAVKKSECKKLGFKWGSFHVGTAGDPIAEADFYLATAKPAKNEVMALDLEDISKREYMDLNGAQRFIERIKEKTGRYPLLYVTGSTHQAIVENPGTESIFAKTGIWYVRNCRSIYCYFPNKVWQTYTLWQFASEINCHNSKITSEEPCLGKDCPINKCPLPKPLPGTDDFMDVNIYYGTVKELRSRWPLIAK